MNKFKKIGLTALASSLVAVSAQAGELSVTGGANATLTWGSADAEEDTTGKSLGTDKDVAFTGSGELDNGTTFTVFTATTDTQGDLTSGGLSVTTPSFGSFLMGHQGDLKQYQLGFHPLKMAYLLVLQFLLQFLCYRDDQPFYLQP